MGLGIGGSAFELAPVSAQGSFTSLDQITTIQTVAVLAGALAYGFAGLGIANGQKVGWRVGVAVAACGVLLPTVAFLRGINLGGGYIFELHVRRGATGAPLAPQSRSPKISFEGPAKANRTASLTTVEIRRAMLEP